MPFRSYFEKVAARLGVVVVDESAQFKRLVGTIGVSGCITAVYILYMFWEVTHK